MEKVLLASDSQSFQLVDAADAAKVFAARPETCDS